VIQIIVAVIIAALAYYILVPLAGLPAIVGVVAAVLILLAGIGGPWYRGRRGPV
jgi:hypothetical protein